MPVTLHTTGIPVVSAPPRTATVGGVTFPASMLEDADVWAILVSHAGGKREVKATYTVEPGPPQVLVGLTRVESV